MIRTKSVWSPIDRERDGIRILATRFRGRGMPTSRYDVWMPPLAPSERLLRNVQGGRITGRSSSGSTVANCSWTARSTSAAARSRITARSSRSDSSSSSPERVA